METQSSPADSTMVLLDREGYDFVLQEEGYIWDRNEPLNTQDKVYAWLTEVEAAHGVSEEVGTSSKCEVGGVYQSVMWTLEGLPIYAHDDMGSIATFSVPKLAWVMWVEAFRIYKRYRYKIYWRKLPEITQTGRGFTVSARVYMHNYPEEKEDN